MPLGSGLGLQIRSRGLAPPTTLVIFYHHLPKLGIELVGAEAAILVLLLEIDIAPTRFLKTGDELLFVAGKFLLFNSFFTALPPENVAQY